ncbi:hypothetical protein GCM10026982_07630 [Nocardiopsis aegyptia]
MPGEEADEGEQVGLLGVAVQAQRCGGDQSCRAQPCGEALHQDGVADPAAGGRHLGHRERAQRVRDGHGGQLREGGQQVGVRGHTDPPQRGVEVGGAEPFQPGRLRRGQRVIGIGEQVVQQGGVGCAGAGERATRVDAGPAAGHPAHGGVHEGVGGTGVERLWWGSVAHDGDVGDAAEVERGGRCTAVGEEEAVQERGQRGALAPGGHVGRSQVGDHRKAGGLGDPRGLAELEGAVDPGALGPVEQGLPVRGDQCGPTAGELLAAATGGFGELLADPGVDPADGLHGGGRRGKRVPDRPAEPGGVGRGAVPERGQTDEVALQVKVGGGDIDPVGRGTRGQPEDDHAAPARVGGFRVYTRRAPPTPA